MKSLLKLNNKQKTPIWFMRQAGRYLPEYKLIRKKQKNFLDLCFSPEIAAAISLQPVKRFNLDFIILFCDILVIPYALGQKVTFEEKIGPVLDPITSLNDLGKINIKKSIDRLNPVFKTLEILKEEKNNQNIIGFCGGPFTVLTYMLEGGSSKKHEITKNFIKNNSKKTDDLISVLIEISIEYLKNQIRSGAQILQIFDSWAGILDGEMYEKYIIQPNKKIFDEIQKKFPEIPIIFFPRNSGKKILNFLLKVKCKAISLDEIFFDEILEFSKKNNIVLQGNLNPNYLVEGGIKLEIQIKKIMEKFKNNLHIFNLSHGILPNTPVANVQKTVQLVKEYYETK